MTTYTVDITEQADRDLRSIYLHIAERLGAPENAKGQLDRLEEAISKLDQMPERYRRYEKSRGVRVTFVLCLWTILSCFIHSLRRRIRLRSSASCTAGATLSMN